MKKWISIQLVFILILSSLSGFASSVKSQSTCENGECVPKLVERLEDLTELYQKECLPKGIKENQLKAHYEKYGLKEQCWKYITEINHLDRELQRHQSLLESRLGCDGGECKLPNANQSLNAQIKALTQKPEGPVCTPEKKQTIKNRCGTDVNCALYSAAISIGTLNAGNYIAEMLIPKNYKPESCHLGDDSCMTQLAMGFLKSVTSLFTGLWELLKMAGGATKDQMTKFWDWVSSAEDQSSTNQLALAKASEDPGFFKMLKDDFPGTMKKIWGTLVASIKEWLKNDVFCDKWQGPVHFGTCVKPAEGFDCITCKAMINGMCTMTGVIVAEVIPAFLTGGLLTAAKFGVSGASKIAKGFNISSKAMAAAKNSRVGKLASEIAAKTDETLKLTQGLRAAKLSVESALQAIRKYMLSPTRKMAKASFETVSALIKKSGATVVVTSAGKILAFGGKSVLATTKVVMYPIDNPMTTFAFRAGERSLDKLITRAAPRLAVTSSVASKVIGGNKEIEILLAKIQEAKSANKTQDIVKLEQELLNKIGTKRPELLKEVLNNEQVDFDEIIRHLYPELQYADLAKTIPQGKILELEKELYLKLTDLPTGPLKTRLLKRYDSHVLQGEARALVVSDASPTYAKIIENSKLNSEARFTETLRILKRDVSPEQKMKLKKALEEAHLSGPDNGVFEYSWLELREKYRILVDGGFSKDEADLLIRSGLAGRPPVRELIQPGETLFSNFAEDILDKDYLKKREELFTLVSGEHPQKKMGLIQRLLGKSPTPNPNTQVIDNFESLYFVDYLHAQPELRKVLEGVEDAKKSTLADIYRPEAFKNFKEARQYLLENQPEISKETLLTVHKKMMNGGVADFGVEADLGKIRDIALIGNVPSSKPISLQIKQEIEANPYLFFETRSEIGGKFSGQIHYPGAKLVQPKTLDIIRKSHPSLVDEIEKFQTSHVELNIRKGALDVLGQESPDYKRLYDEYSALHTNLTSVEKKLTQKLVDALVDDLMDWFNRQKALIGEINSPEKLDEYVNVLADFQRKLISIHPLMDGNGRTTREVALSYALMKEGFPPPRIMDPNADIYTSLDEWRRMIKHGILASDFFVDDMIERLKFGLPLENSVELITPYTRPPVKMALKGEKKVPAMEGVEYIDPRLYREIMKRELRNFPNLTRNLNENPIATWDQIHQKAQEVFAKNNIYYKHPKYGIERVELGYVDDDFKILFGKFTAGNKELYDFKMKTWYSEDITWRGLASKSRERSEPEIIDMFKNLSAHNASNAVVSKSVTTQIPKSSEKRHSRILKNTTMMFLVTVWFKWPKIILRPAHYMDKAMATPLQKTARSVRPSLWGPWLSVNTENIPPLNFRPS